MLASQTEKGDSRYLQILEWLEKPSFDGFSSSDLFIKQFIKQAWGQDIAALSNMAELLSAKIKKNPDSKCSLKPHFEQIIHRMRHTSVSPYNRDVLSVSNLNHQGYYLEHLNICLGLYEMIYRDGQFTELHHRVSHYLSIESLSQSNAHARLIPHVKMRWSADQAAILYSLWLFDQCNDQELSLEPIARWRHHMNSHMRHSETGLFNTEVMGVKRYSNEPRGCAIAYLCHYTKAFAPDIANEQWRLFKEHFRIKKLSITGFREYREGYNGKWTPDSGPIISDIGVAASGLALKTAATMNDAETFNALKRSIKPTLTLFKYLGYVPGIKRLALIGNDLLASSIYACAMTNQPHQENQMNQSEEILGNTALTGEYND